MLQCNFSNRAWCSDSFTNITTQCEWNLPSCVKILRHLKKWTHNVTNSDKTAWFILRMAPSHYFGLWVRVATCLLTLNCSWWRILFLHAFYRIWDRAHLFSEFSAFIFYARRIKLIKHISNGNESQCDTLCFFNYKYTMNVIWKISHNFK